MFWVATQPLNVSIKMDAFIGVSNGNTSLHTFHIEIQFRKSNEGVQTSFTQLNCFSLNTAIIVS